MNSPGEVPLAITSCGVAGRPFAGRVSSTEAAGVGADALSNLARTASYNGAFYTTSCNPRSWTLLISALPGSWAHLRDVRSVGTTDDSIGRLFYRPYGTWFLLCLTYPGLTLRLRSGQAGAKLFRRSAAGVEWLLWARFEG
jgi:hypothetical protein